LVRVMLSDLHEEGLLDSLCLTKRWLQVTWYKRNGKTSYWYVVVALLNRKLCKGLCRKPYQVLKRSLVLLVWLVYPIGFLL
jgi:hypothetical protein